MEPEPHAKRVADLVVGKCCPICLNPVELRSAAVLVPCKHAYCVDCIRRWSDLKRLCPLCNANFSSWLCKKDRLFQEEKLLPSRRENASSSVFRDSMLLRRRRAQFLEQQRLIRRSREYSSIRTQSRVLPRQRSFVSASHESPDIIAERIRQWRASIYEKGLRAVPSPLKNGLMQQILRTDDVKEMVRKRIEPWIHRELQAVLGDPDPSIIVHVATSLFISRHERNQEEFPTRIGSEDDFLSPLRECLHDKTEAFWHELRCFAESSYSMETYDTVVEYKGSRPGRHS